MRHYVLLAALAAPLLFAEAPKVYQAKELKPEPAKSLEPERPTPKPPAADAPAAEVKPTTAGSAARATPAKDDE